MKLTIGMATFNDWERTLFTVQNVKLQLKQLGMRNDAEIIIVDNDPESIASPHLNRLATDAICSGGWKTRYLPFNQAWGTAQPRNAIFDNARGDIVIVMDSHILMVPDTIHRMVRYLEMPDCRDIVSGPILFDNLDTMATHFEPVWRESMFGVWGTAWYDHTHGWMASVAIDVDGKKRLAMRHLMGTDLAYTPDDLGLAWEGHQTYLPRKGFVHGAESWMPFEIPAMGLGLFGMRKEFWPGFNRDMRGFGGEECYIHEKVRRAGGRAMCLPEALWWHSFNSETSVTYPLRTSDKIRNNVIAWRELGWNVDEIRQHFRVNDAAWAAIMANPAEFADPKQKQSGAGMPIPPQLANVDDVFNWACRTPRDLNLHLPRLKELAAKCDYVAEITKRRESSVALLAARPKKLVSLHSEHETLLANLGVQVSREGATDWQLVFGDSLTASLGPCDMLFIDSQHTYSRLTAELERFAPTVSRFIVMHDTQLYGKVGEDKQPGLMHAIADFLTKNPNWFIVSHTTKQFGLTVMGCQEQDRPSQPVMVKAPDFGPGTELKKILESVGVNPSPECTCNQMASQMNLWGVDGCREHRQDIIKAIKDNQAKWGWSSFFTTAGTAVWKAMSTGLWRELSVSDIHGSLVDLAIKRASTNESNRVNADVSAPSKDVGKLDTNVSRPNVAG